MAEAHEVEGVRTVEELIAGSQVDEFVMGVVVVVAPVDVHIYAAHGVGDVAEGLEADLDVVLDVDAGEFFDRLDRKSGPSGRECEVDLVVSVTGYVHPQVPRQRQERHVVVLGIDMRQDDRVGTGVLVRVFFVGPTVGTKDEYVHGRR